MIAMNSSNHCNEQQLHGCMHFALLFSVPMGWLGHTRQALHAAILGLSKMQLSQVVSTNAGGCVVD